MMKVLVARHPLVERAKQQFEAAARAAAPKVVLMLFSQHKSTTTVYIDLCCIQSAAIVFSVRLFMHIIRGWLLDGLTAM